MPWDEFSKARLARLLERDPGWVALRLQELARERGALTEEQARGGHPDSWPFEQAAIVCRKQKDFAAEVVAVQRYVETACFCGPKQTRLYERLPKALRRAGGQELPPELYGAVGAVVDIETTGLGPEDELIEIGIVRFRFDKRTGEFLETLDEYAGLREPTHRISQRAKKRHGLSEDDLRGRQFDAQQVSEVLMGSDLLIAHNAVFDRRMLGALVPLAESRLWTCSLRGLPWSSMGFSSSRLEDLLTAHDIEAVKQHRALEDAHCLLRLLRCKGSESNATYLSELRLATGYRGRASGLRPSAIGGRSRLATRSLAPGSAGQSWSWWRSWLSLD